MTALFIGVVSHPATRFTTSVGPDGLGQQLAAHLGALGVVPYSSVVSVQ